MPSRRERRLVEPGGVDALHDVGGDPARGDGVAAQVLLGVLERRALGEPDQRVLGRRIGRSGGPAAETRHRVDIDDRAAALGQHQRHSPPHGEHRAVEIDRQHPAPGLVVDIGDGLEQVHHAGIVDEDIDATELGDGAIDHGDALGLDRDVGGNADDGAADLGDRRGDGIGMPVGGDDLCALGHEQLGNGEAHPGACTGDNRNLVFQPHLKSPWINELVRGGCRSFGLQGF